MTNTYKERRKQKKLDTYNELVLRKDRPYESLGNKPIKPNIDTKTARYLMIWYIKSQNTMVYVWRNTLGSVIRAQGYRYTNTG